VTAPGRLLFTLVGVVALVCAAPALVVAQTVELSFGGAFVRAESLGRFDLAFDSVDDDPSTPTVRLAMSLPLRIDHGWGFEPTVTLHTGRWLSHEITYSYSQSDLIFDFAHVDYALLVGGDRLISGMLTTGDPHVERLVVREIGYAPVFNFRPRGARIQPYAQIGPRLVAYRFKNGGGSSSSFFRRVGLGTIGSIVSGIRAGRGDPLDGGTIYRWGFGYGGGVRLSLTETLGVRLDLRETVIASPNFAKGEPEDLIPGLPGPNLFAQDPKTLQRFQVSLGMTFRF
jgi:Outer membrane protein beta-barrel domain